MKTNASRSKKLTQTRPTVVPFKPPQQNEDVIESLAYLYAEAVEGRITGIAYVAMIEKGRYLITDIAGEANRKPIHALGAVHMLANRLVRQANGEE